jgi:hypothetical protein
MKKRIRVAPIFEQAAKHIETGQRKYGCHAVHAALLEHVGGQHWLTMQSSTHNLMKTFGVVDDSCYDIETAFGLPAKENARSFRIAYLQQFARVARELDMRITIEVKEQKA